MNQCTNTTLQAAASDTVTRRVPNYRVLRKESNSYHILKAVIPPSPYGVVL
ncbi:MAG: hypothetical protein ABR985_06140 [Methanotrichaceae archaeon]